MRYGSWILGLCLLASGCSSAGASGMAAGTGDFGATPGGVQDLQFARGLVEQGAVPPKEAVLVEAMFSEHDLPLDGAPCAELLCLRGAVGVAPKVDGASAVWAQVGMSSTIDPATYQRPPLAIVATVDISGSMGWDYGENGSAGAIARALLNDMAGKLTQGDDFALVTYGDTASTPLAWTNGADPAIKQAIADLHTGGSTNMEAGLSEAFAEAEVLVRKGRDVRVILFTDTQPNVGATSPSDFETMVAAASEKGIGLTVLGLGLGMGADLLKSMSHLRGGNAFSVMKPADEQQFMDDNWPWLALPIAYDLKMTAQPSAGLVLSSSFGFPESASGVSSGLDVSTVFLSKRRGGLLLELEKDAGAPAVQGDGVAMSLSYTDPQGTAHQTSLAPAFDGTPVDDRGVSMPEPGIARTVSLALFTSEMHRALELYGSDEQQSVEVLTAALTRLNDDATATNDTDLATEAQFWAKLLTLMEQRAPQGDLYGGF